MKGPTNLGNSLRVSPVHVTAYVGSIAVESSTLSPTLNTFSFALLCASAFAFCRATASAIASLTKRISASRLYISSLAKILCFFPCLVRRPPFSRTKVGTLVSNAGSARVVILPGESPVGTGARRGSGPGRTGSEPWGAGSRTGVETGPRTGLDSSRTERFDVLCEEGDGGSSVTRVTPPLR